MKPSMAFLFLSAIGVLEAFYHAWSENAFTTNWSLVNFSPNASFVGIPYWVFGVVWFPLVLVVGFWTTRYGRAELKGGLLVLLSVGNVFTVYLWFLDLVVIRAFTAAYVGLYVTNYALTGLVVAQNWSSSAMRGFLSGTLLGIVIGVFLGPIGVAALGVTGGILGAVGGYTSTK